MVVTIKISSTFKNYFEELEHQVDINSYYDIENYLRGVHPKFSNYIKQIQSGQSQESFAYLDKNLNVVEPQSYPMKKLKDDDIIYIAPVISGGGGKKGMIFAAVAFVAIGFASGGFSSLFRPALTPTSIGMGAGQAATHAAVSGALGSGGLLAGIPSFVRGMLGNLALSFIGALLTSKPKQKQMEVTKDSGTRTENNMFGSLTNTTTSGTPVQLNYGTMRVAGQFLSGYIVSQQHGQNDAPSVQSLFVAGATPLSTATEEEAA